MNMKMIQCRVHGGKFSIPVKAGRPPTKCSEANPCDMAGGSRPVARKRTPVPGNRPVDKVAAEVKTRSVERKAKKTVTRRPDREEAPQKATRTRPEASNVTVRHNPSVPLAKKAKDQLEPLGWELKGRAWVDEADIAWAEIVASRGEETLVLRWADGKFDSQEYSLWDSDKTPEQNNKPKSRLPFDPDEMSDEELARELSGRRVTWWNRLAQASESAIIGDTLQIQHNFTGGDETSRQVLFVDKTPNRAAFRAFHVDALMRVK